MAANDYYDSSGAPATGSQGSSATMRAEFDAIEAGFNKLPALTGNASKAVVVNTSGNALTVTTGTLALGVPLTTSGTGSLTLTTAGTTSVNLDAASAGQILRASGADTWVASTATFPDTVSGAGKILRASGANTWAASTATYPDTAASAGTILRADGTNWVASTATYPNTVAANRVMYATGANTYGDSVNLTFDGTTLTAHTLTVSTGALTAVNATISGNLGVGTATPGARLAINGGLHVGGDSDPGDNNALIDGTLTVGGAATISGTLTVTNPDNVNQTLTDAATISWDMNSGGIATVTLGGNRTMAAPTNLKRGTYILKVIQPAAGGPYTLTWNSVFKWSKGTAPTLSSAANAVDVFSFFCDGTNLYGAMIADAK